MSQNKRKVISLELKLEIIKRFKSGEKAVNIGRALGLAPTTVRTIFNRDSDKINQLAEIVTPLQSKKATKARNPLLVKMESHLLIWIHDQEKRRMSLSKDVIKNKALSIYYDLRKNTGSTSNENFDHFEASNGWFKRFKTRSNLHNMTLKGEAASADSVAAEKLKLNADKISLFWRQLPSRTYFSKDEKACSGYKDGIDDSPNVIYNLANITRKAEFKEVEEDDINEFLLTHDEELDNENLLATDIQHVSEDDVIIIDDDTVEEKKLTIENISKAMKLISHAMDIFAENDPNENRSKGVAISVDQAISCYKEIYERKTLKKF